MSHTLQQQIIKIFANNPSESFNDKQIASRMGIHDRKGRHAVSEVLSQLGKAEVLVEDGQRGRYRINPSHLDDYAPHNYLTGTIDMKKGGKAYVIPNEEGVSEDILITPNNCNHALHGDTVKVLLFPQRHSHKPEGQVVEILQRARTRFVGNIQRQEKYAFMVSSSHTMPVDIFIPLNDLGGAEDGEKVLVEMTEWPKRLNNPVGRVVKRLGRPGDNNVEMQSILAEYDFPLDFGADVLQEAERLQGPTDGEKGGRKDFREVLTFTIDPADAKDFDDALSYRVLDNGNVEVGVHIADVTHYVKPGSAIDREAYERGTSVYLVDRTIPMLPERLCNELCSLRPNEEKLCFSAVFELNEKAQVKNQWFGKTVINSDHRYAYEEAQAIIDAHIASEGKDEGADALEQAVIALHRLASTMRAERFKIGAIDFDSQEVKFILDEQARPIGVYIKEQKEANWLIEEFMLLANKKVAELVGKKAPRSKVEPKTFVYRIHDEPNPEKLQTFVEFAAKLGYKLKVGSRKALAQSYNHLFEQIAGRGEEYMIDSIAIRTMSKAKYSTENIGHYGLAFPYYTHFTSPIRRYPDMMVHRLLERYLEGGPSVDAEQYEEYCVHCSITEKKAADAERTSVKYKQAEYLSDKQGQVFDAHISGVSKWGIYAEIEGNKCEGLIRIDTLRDDYYMLDEDNYQVIGRRHGHCYKLGDIVKIRVMSVDMLKRQINFELAEERGIDEMRDGTTGKGEKKKDDDKNKVVKKKHDDTKKKTARNKKKEEGSEKSPKKKRKR